MDVEAYLVAEVREKLLATNYSSMDEIAQTAVETVLNSLELSSAEPDNENVIDYGVSIWLTLSAKKIITIKDLKEFISKAEQLGLSDEQIVQGSLSIEHVADVESLIAQE